MPCDVPLLAELAVREIDTLALLVGSARLVAVSFTVWEAVMLAGAR